MVATGAPEPAKKRAPKKAKEIKPVKFKDLRALKAAKSRMTLPRGLRAHHDVGDPQIVFKLPGQVEPVLKIDVDAFVASSLRSAGFNLA